jgi:hypothetical protein
VNTRGSGCTDVNGVGRIGPAFVCQVQGRSCTWYLSTTSCSLDQGKPRRDQMVRCCLLERLTVSQLTFSTSSGVDNFTGCFRKCNNRHRRRLIGSIFRASEVNPVRSGNFGEDILRSINDLVALGVTCSTWIRGSSNTISCQAATLQPLQSSTSPDSDQPIISNTPQSIVRLLVIQTHKGKQ